MRSTIRMERAWGRWRRRGGRDWRRWRPVSSIRSPSSRRGSLRLRLATDANGREQAQWQADSITLAAAEPWLRRFVSGGGGEWGVVGAGDGGLVVDGGWDRELNRKRWRCRQIW